MVLSFRLLNSPAMTRTIISDRVTRNNRWPQRHRGAEKSSPAKRHPGRRNVTSADSKPGSRIYLQAGFRGKGVPRDNSAADSVPVYPHGRGVNRKFDLCSNLRHFPQRGCIQYPFGARLLPSLNSDVELSNVSTLPQLPRQRRQRSHQTTKTANCIRWILWVTT
jgi:hypothetical protein